MTAPLFCSVDQTYWHNKRVFLTGHTGFKGSWLSLWLTEMGAEVYGYSLEPETEPAMFTTLELEGRVASHQIADLCDQDTLFAAVRAAEPDVVIHMAAQPIVSIGYQEPLQTFNVNVMGTAMLLEACRQVAAEIPLFVVSSDKCYLNLDTGLSFKENDSLGGKDPYSASKAATELVVSSWRQSFFNSPGGPHLSSGRAGNVVGGGDWSCDRLLPDMMRAFSAGEPAVIRNPKATRPWQHVIEPLAGYLIAIQGLAKDVGMARSWNFGPNADQHSPVEQVVELSKKTWGSNAKHTLVGDPQNWQEAKTLGLDCSLACKELGWKPVFSLPKTIELTVGWYRAFYSGADPATMRALSLDQISEYCAALAGKEHVISKRLSGQT